MSNNPACYAVGPTSTVIVTAPTFEETWEVFWEEPVYYEGIHTLASQYGVTPFFLLCAPEHAYYIDNDLLGLN